MNLVYVNNVLLNNISGLDVGWYDVSKNSGREVSNANGDMILNVVNDKYRIDITTNYMSEEELIAFFSQIRVAPTMSVRFFNPYVGDYTTATMYRGDRKVSFQWDIEKKLYKPITIALIEI